MDSDLKKSPFAKRNCFKKSPLVKGYSFKKSPFGKGGFRGIQRSLFLLPLTRTTHKPAGLSLCPQHQSGAVWLLFPKEWILSESLCRIEVKYQQGYQFYRRYFHVK
ncbi:MAG: hypothetical protein KGZ42_03415 [Melioribacter sp.]|nr:hypothetical protein [Melioribacter sp.]